MIECTPEEALRLQDMEPHGEWYISLRGMPSNPRTYGEMWRGMGFDINGNQESVICTISAESFRKAGYDAAKVPTIMKVIKCLEENRIPLKVEGKYRPKFKILEVDYGKALEEIDKALIEAENKQILEASARLTSTGNF